MTVIVIMVILVLLLIPAFDYIRQRIEKARCINNLKTLHIAANLHVQEKRSWPQIVTGNFRTPEYALQWIHALEPYGALRESWICPTMQRLQDSPDFHNDKNARLDYLPTPFGPKQIEPYEWPRHPWFSEKGDVHGSGNLIIFTSGEIVGAREFR